MAKKGSDLTTHIFYSVLLLFSAIAATIAASTPFWIKSGYNYENITLGINSTFACGVLTDCRDSTDPECDIEPYGDELEDIPINDWRIAAVMLGIACTILWLSFLVSFVTCCFFYSCTKIQAPLIGLATLFLFSSMIAFGHGLDETRKPAGAFIVDEVNSKVRCNCGPTADSFDNADCELGFGANFAIAATVITLFTSCIAYKVKDQDIDSGRYDP